MPPLSSLPPPNKRRKIKPSSNAPTILGLENQLTSAVSDNSSLNSLADLLELAFSQENAQDASKAVYALYRVFVMIISDGKLGAAGDEDAKVVRTWIWERLNAYIDFLVGLLKDEEKMLRVSALQILFSLLKHLSTSSSIPGQPQFNVPHFKKIIHGLLVCPPSARGSQTSDGRLDADVRDSFVDTWLSVNDDIRWFFLRDAAPVLAENPKSHAAINLLSILEKLHTFPTEASEINSWWVAEIGVKPPKPKHTKKGPAGAESDEEDEEVAGDDADDWRKFFDEEVTPAGPAKKAGSRLHTLTVHQSLHALGSHRAVFTRTWLALLPRLSVSDGGRTLSMRALNVMHRGVLPHLTRPILVMDWVGTCVDLGGTVGLLALNALFVLMKEYNLDYPSFYTRLYAFLDRDVLHLRHRARFFRMTELFLSSTHIPATLLASFIKRLARLSLNAPPAAIIMIIPFTYNVLKRHPALMAMIHRPQEDDVDSDPFLPDEENPNATNALESSLWELVSHKRHYNAGVSTLVKIFEEAFTKPGFSMEDFLDHTYGTLLDTDLKRKIKKEPAMADELKKGLFLGKANGEGEDAVVYCDVVSELWSF